MLANTLQKLLDRDSRIHDRKGPAISAAPHAAARLQLLASSSVADLEAITSIIRDDLGLTIRLLQLAEQTLEENAGNLSLEELVIHLGLEQLRRMAAETALSPKP